MQRRQYLVAVAGLTSASVAGCSALRAETTLEPPTEERDGESFHHVYEHDGEEVLVVSFRQRPDSEQTRRLQVVLEQPRGTVYEEIRLRFRPATPEPGAVAVYVRPPGGGHGERDLYRQADWTVIETADSGEGTTGFDVLVTTDGTDAELSPLLVDYEITLAEGGLRGPAFTAQDRTTLDLDGMRPVAERRDAAGGVGVVRAGWPDDE